MIPTLIAIVNFVALLAFVGLSGATLFAMVRRLVLFRRAEQPLPVLLKRGLVLIGALLIIGLELALLRVLEVTLAPDSLERLVFIVQSDLIILTALGYYTKVEIFDIDDPDKQ